MIIATTAANIAAQNAARIAQQRHVEACTNNIAAFDSHNASAQAMQEYASCVDYLYPISGNDSVGKIIVALLLVGAIIGAVRGYVTHDWCKTEHTVTGGLEGLLVALLGIVLVGSVMFIFS